MSVATWTYGEFQHFARIASVKAKQGFLLDAESGSSFNT